MRGTLRLPQATAKPRAAAAAQPPTWDPKEPTAEQLGGTARYIQQGWYFAKNHTPIGPVPPELMPKLPTKEQEQARQKLSLVKKRQTSIGAVTASIPQQVVDAERENARAAHAEELSG